MARNFINQLLNRNQGPVLPVLQMDENGQFDPAAAARVEMEQTPLTLRDRLLGRELTKDIVQTDPKSGETNMATISSVRSGLLPDLAKGYNENYNQGLNFNNFGQKKGWAEKIGEGLGTVGRVIDSPLGRGLLAAGLNSALGYDNSLQEGLTAAVGRQNAQTADRIYRQQLAAQGIDTSNVGGNITGDIYKQLLAAKTLEESMNYRNAMLKSMDENRKATLALREQEAEYKKERDKKQDEFNRERLSQGWTRIRDAREARAAKNTDLKSVQDGLASLNAIEKQLNNYQSMFKGMPGKWNTYTVGKLREKTGMQTETQAEFESRTNLLFNKIARDLGGEKGVLSDQDIARVKDAMPKYTDSLAQKNAKMKAINDLLSIAKEKYQYKLSTMAEPVSMDYATADEGWAF